MTRLLLVFGLLATLTGCNSLAEAIVEASEGNKTTVAITFTGIEAIKDCDGIEGYGDFDFHVAAKSSFPSSVSGEVHRSTPQLTDGQRTGNLGRRVFEGPATEGEKIMITFTASEIDTPLIGADYNDTRLDKLSRTTVHTFRDGQWDKLGNQFVTLGGGDCRVRLHYAVDQVS